MHFDLLKPYVPRARDVRDASPRPRSSFERLVPLFEEFMAEHRALPAVFGTYLMLVNLGHKQDKCMPQGYQFLRALKTAQEQTPDLVAGWQMTSLVDAVPRAFNLPSYAALQPTPWVGPRANSKLWHKPRGTSHVVFTDRYRFHEYVRDTIEVTVRKNAFCYRVR